MIIKKWDYKIKEYKDAEIPDDWKVKTYCADMDEVVNCVNCGKELTFGNGYTSRRYHTGYGIGYCECKECYFAYMED